MDRVDRGTFAIPITGLILAMMLWGSSFIAMKFAVSACNPFMVMLGRMSVASCVFLLFGKRFGKINYRRGDWKFLGFMVLCEPCLYFTFETHALKLTSASEAATITALLPLMTMLAARFTLSENLSYSSFGGLGVALLGVIGLNLFANQTHCAPRPVLGNFLELIAMACATGYTVSCRYLSSRYSPFFLTAVQAFVGSIFFAPALLFMRSNITVPFSWAVWASIIYLGAVVNVAAYFLYNYGLSRIPASQVSPYVNLIPVFSMLLGWALLDEQLTIPQYASAGLVIGGTLAGRVGENGAQLNARPISPSDTSFIKNC